jgi:hypothetical protein
MKGQTEGARLLPTDNKSILTNAIEYAADISGVSVSMIQQKIGLALDLSEDRIRQIKDGEPLSKARAVKIATAIADLGGFAEKQFLCQLLSNSVVNDPVICDDLFARNIDAQERILRSYRNQAPLTDFIELSQPRRKRKPVSQPAVSQARSRGAWIRRNITILLCALAALAVILVAVFAISALPRKPVDIGVATWRGTNGMQLLDNGHEIKSGDTVPAGDTVTVKFWIFNFGRIPEEMKILTAGSRGPGVTCKGDTNTRWGKFPVIAFRPEITLVLFPGWEHLYTSTYTFTEQGYYFVEATVEDMAGEWGGVGHSPCMDFLVAR